jgi:alkylhydroperoxidase family enzyme
MSRIPPIDPDTVSGYAASVLAAQARTWGAPLNNHLVYAHRPKLFKAVRGMWSAVDADGLLGPGLLALVNRRVASLNGCVF